MEISDITVKVKVDDTSLNNAMDKLKNKLQEMKYLKDEMSGILSEIDQMLNGKDFLIIDNGEPNIEEMNENINVKELVYNMFHDDK